VNCDELLDLLLDYVGGDLVVEQRTTVEVHLSGCERCGILIHSYTQTVRLARALPQCCMSAEFEARLKKELEPHLSQETGTAE
jgi:anti-sigma factor RsiW